MKAKYMLEVVLPNSANTREDYHVEQRLYGHDEVVALAEVYFNLKPNDVGGYYHEWEQPPVVKLKASAFFQDQDGGDYEREVELTDEEHAYVMDDLYKQVKHLEKPIIYLQPRGV